MQNTTYFDLDVYEGSDIFNPLTVENANMEKIDEQLFLNSIATVGQAVELKSGTVHAITRTNPDASMFRFVATSRYDKGDTFTVDGIQVTGLLTDGTTLSDGAYAINANVLCCLTGTVLTLYTVPGAIQTAQNALKLGGQIPEYYGKASDVEQATLVAQAAGTLANQVNSNLTALEGRVEALENNPSKDIWDDDNVINIISYSAEANKFTVPKKGIIWAQGTNLFGISGFLKPLNAYSSLVGGYVPSGSSRQVMLPVYEGQEIFVYGCTMAYFIPYK